MTVAVPPWPLRMLIGASLLVGGCAGTSHVQAYQEAPIAPAPRAFVLALDAGEPLPFGLTSGDIARAAGSAGFVLTDDRAAYRLGVSAAESGGTTYIPPAAESGRRAWVARSNGDWRTRFGGDTLRITAVLIDQATNREIWRGTGTLRTRDAAAAAPDLMRAILGRLPRG